MQVGYRIFRPDHHRPHHKWGAKLSKHPQYDLHRCRGAVVMTMIMLVDRSPTLSKGMVRDQ